MENSYRHLNGYYSFTPKGAGKATLQAGESGSYAELAARGVRGDKLTPHHMPQAAAEFTSYSKGGTIALPESEHFLTRTFGGKGIVTLREDAELTFRQVLYKDIRDVRSISGRKYNQGLLDTIDYYRTNFTDLMQKP